MNMSDITSFADITRVSLSEERRVEQDGVVRWTRDLIFHGPDGAPLLTIVGIGDNLPAPGVRADKRRTDR